jgi:hypothetical protein
VRVGGGGRSVCKSPFRSDPGGGEGVIAVVLLSGSGDAQRPACTRVALGRAGRRGGASTRTLVTTVVVFRRVGSLGGVSCVAVVNATSEEDLGKDDSTGTVGMRNGGGGGAGRLDCCCCAGE